MISMEKDRISPRKRPRRRARRPSSDPQSQPDAPTEPASALLEAIRADLAAARAALGEGQDERALRLLERAIAGKHELWRQLSPDVQALARRYSSYARLAAGLEADDLVDEGYAKFLKAIAV